MLQGTAQVQEDVYKWGCSTEQTIIYRYQSTIRPLPELQHAVLSDSDVPVSRSQGYIQSGKESHGAGPIRLTQHARVELDCCATPAIAIITSTHCLQTRLSSVGLMVWTYSLPLVKSGGATAPPAPPVPMPMYSVLTQHYTKVLQQYSTIFQQSHTGSTQHVQLYTTVLKVTYYALYLCNRTVLITHTLKVPAQQTSVVQSTQIYYICSAIMPCFDKYCRFLY